MSISYYSKEELYKSCEQRKFKNDATEAAFLLGGIGTGNVSIGARGEFRDWEIFNRPGKGNKLPYAFFAIRMKEEGYCEVARVLEAQITKPFSGSNGVNSAILPGLPRLQGSIMKVEYPFVKINYEDDKLPLEISMESFNPIIPLNLMDSSIPCVNIAYRIKNKSKNNIDVSIIGNLCNPISYDWNDPLWGTTYSKNNDVEANKNEFRKDNIISGLYMYSEAFDEDHYKYGNITLTSTNENITYKTNWLSGGWWDGIYDLWDDFLSDGRLEPESNYEAYGNGLNATKLKIGSIGAYNILAPGEEKEFRFILSWYFPNRIKTWNENGIFESNKNNTVQLFYSNFFQNSWDIAKYAAINYQRLYRESKLFCDAFIDSKLPAYVIEAVTANITVLRSPTCFVLKNGTFLGWEGCDDKAGSCPGNCTHVWNYAQTVAFLFPELEKSMRNSEFMLETNEEGRMEFRTFRVFAEEAEDNAKEDSWVSFWRNFPPAVDGQMGSIIRLYREWKISGDNVFLKKLWGKAKKALEFAFKYWDVDGDNVLDSQQHNTYDIEFFGPNSLANSMFFAALKAAGEMALVLGDEEAYEKYNGVLELGSKKMDQMLWGGEYYIQKTDNVNEYRYQYGNGCLSDQLFGQMLAHVTGLGYILPEEHVKSAIISVFRYNFLGDFSNHYNVQRTYALNNEAGLVLCSWPFGGRPRLPFVYSDEVWTGIEYQVAAHLIYEGFIDEGLTIVKAVRDRHDGYRRNPWNEVECGHHYARSMASWAILTALSGYQCDLINGFIKFNPVINKADFKCFFSCGKAWGMYSQKLNVKLNKYEYKVEVLYGSLESIEVIANGEIIPREYVLKLSSMPQ